MTESWQCLLKADRKQQNLVGACKAAKEVAAGAEGHVGRHFFPQVEKKMLMNCIFRKFVLDG
jgi:hypothetical protein